MESFRDSFRRKVLGLRPREQIQAGIKQKAANKLEIAGRVRQAEKLRVKSILALPEAKSNPELAEQLAYSGDCSLEDAKLMNPLIFKRA
jgi:hypothetical protein